MPNNGTTQLSATPTDDTVRAWAAEDAKCHADADTAAWLRQPENLERWRAALVRIAQDLTQAFIERRARVREAKATSRPLYEYEMTEYARWSAKAGRVTNSVNRRIAECKALQRERDDASRGEWRSTLEQRLDDLEERVAGL